MSLARLLLLAPVALACAREPIRVGMVASLTGRNTDLGISSRNAVALAVSEIDQAGGIAGRKLELVVRDDGHEPERARRAVEELSAAGVVAILGPTSSTMAEVVVPVADREKVLLVSPMVASPAFSGLDDWFVRVAPTADVAGRGLAGEIVARGLAHHMAVVWDRGNRAYAQPWAEAFAARLRASGRPVESVPYVADAAFSFDALAEEVLRTGVDGVAVCASALDVAALFQQLRKRSATVRLFGSEWAFTQELLVQGGEATEGALFPAAMDMDDDSPRFRRLVTAYEARYQRPVDFAAVRSYEAAQLLAEALRRDRTRSGVRAAVLEVGAAFPGLQGTIQLDRFGDAVRTYSLFTVAHGRMVKVK
jgi:branched-chain amino acid transport system substrate-binding protein